MPIDLTSRFFRTGKPRFLDYGGELAGPLGGDVLRLNRLGSRFALEVSWALVPEEPDGRTLAQDLRLAKEQGALYRFPQPGLRIGVPGAPVVDGAVAGGSIVPLRGLAPGYAFRYGQFLSFVHDGRRYLHSAAALAIAGGAGDVELTIHPMLRISLADGDVAEVAQPMIQGLLGGGDIEHEIMREPLVGFPAFTITEAK